MPDEGDRRAGPDGVEVFRDGEWHPTSSTASGSGVTIRSLGDGWTGVYDKSGNLIRQDPPPGGGGRTSAGIPGVFEDERGYYVMEPRAGGGWGSSVGGTEQKRYLQPNELFALEDQWSRPSSRGGGGGVTGNALLGAQIDRERMAQDQAQFDVNAQLERAGLAEEMRQFDLEYAAQGEEMAFLEDKFRVEEELGRSAEARASRALMEQIAARQEDNRFRYEQLRQQAQQAEIQNQLALRDQQMQEQEMARRAEGERQDRLRATNMDIASLSADSGDRGALAGAMLGGELLGTQIAEGADFRTAESLGPLDQLLGLRDQLMNPGGAGGMQGGGISFGDGTRFAQDLTPEQLQARIDAMTNQTLGNALQGNPGSLNVGGVDDAALRSQGFRTTQSEFERMGSNPEGALNYNADTGEYDRRIFAAEGFNGIVDEPTQLIVGEGGQPEQVNVTPIPSAPDTTTQGRPARALTWLDQVTQRAARGTPFQQDVGAGRLPTPIGVSAPGTSPYVQRLAGSITASATGTPLDAFLAEIMRVMPWGVNAGIVGRSA